MRWGMKSIPLFYNFRETFTKNLCRIAKCGYNVRIGQSQTDKNAAAELAQAAAFLSV